MFHAKQSIYGLALVAALLAASVAQATWPSVNFDFRDGVQGWEVGFSDFAPNPRDNLNLQWELRDLPGEVGEGTGLWISGHNSVDDLFMFLKRLLGPEEGIAANQSYRVLYTITFASDAPSGCMGIGGAPGEGVCLKAGATPIEPEPVPNEFGVLIMNVDKGNQAVGGPAASSTGDIANGIPCEEAMEMDPVPYVSIERAHRHEYIVESNEAGELWLLLGTDSGFEGTTAIYYQNISVMLIPVADGISACKPTGPKPGAEALPK